MKNLKYCATDRSFFVSTKDVIYAIQSFKMISLLVSLLAIENL